MAQSVRSRSGTSLRPAPGRTTRQCSFPKALRFKAPRSERTAEYIAAPSSLVSRSISFGIGARPALLNSEGKDSPPPGLYQLPTGFPVLKGRLVGRTEKRQALRTDANVGPGAYSPYRPFWESARKSSFGSRRSLKPRSKSPPPNQYNPSSALVRPTCYSRISFGIGSRTNFAVHSEGPGPGAYSIDSAYDRLSFYKA